MSIAAIERCWSIGRQAIATQPSAFKSLLLKYVNIAVPVALNKGGTGATTAAGARANLGIAPTGGFADAPKDGALYGRRNATWQAILQEDSFRGVWDVATNDPDLAAETPSGGQYFIVSVAGTAPAALPGIGGQALGVGDQVIWDAAASQWKRVPGGGLPDAPSDGTLYGRKDGAWEQVQPGGLAPGDVVPIAQGGTGATTASAALTGLGVTSAISSAVAGVTQTSLGGPFLPLTGGTLTPTAPATAASPTLRLASDGTDTSILRMDSAVAGTAWVTYAWETWWQLSLNVGGTDTWMLGFSPVGAGAIPTAFAQFTVPVVMNRTLVWDSFSGQRWEVFADAAGYQLSNSVNGTMLELDWNGTLTLGGKVVVYGAADSAAPGYRTMMIEN